MKNFKCFPNLVGWLIFLAAANFAQTVPQLVVRTKVFADPDNSISNAQTIFSPDGKFFSQTTFSNGYITIYEAETERAIGTIRATLSPLSVISPGGLPIAFSRDAKKMAVGGDFGQTNVYDIASGKLLHSMQVSSLMLETGTVAAVKFTNDDRFIINGGNALRIWDAETGRLVRQFAGHNGAVFALAIAPDGKTLASAGADNRIRLWTIADGKQILEIATVTPVKQIVFGKNGQTLHGYNEIREIVSWNAANGKQTAKFNIGSDIIRFDPNSATISAVDTNYKTNIWSISTGKIIKTTEPRAATTGKIELDSSPKIVFNSQNSSFRGLTVVGTKSIFHFLFEKGNPVAVSSDETAYLSNPAYSPDGKVLANKSVYGRTIELREPLTWKIIRTLTGEFDKFYKLQFRPDGKLMAATDVGVIVWNTETGAVEKIFDKVQKRGENFSFSANGKRLVSVENDTLTVTDIESGAEKLSVSIDIYKRAVLSPDGKLLAANGASIGGIEDRTTIYDVETGAAIRDLMQTRIIGSGDGTANSAFAFSADGKILACGSLDGSIELWNAETGGRIGQLAGQRGQIDDLQFDAEGKFLASVADDEIAVWNVAELRKIANFYITGESDWAIVAPDARFQISPNFGNFMHWLGNGKPTNFDIFREKFDTPDLLGKIFAEKKFDAVRLKNEVLPAPTVKIEVFAKTKNIGDEAEIKVEIVQGDGDFAELQLRHNGKLVGAEKGENFKRESSGNLTKTYRLPLVSGINDFRAVALNAANLAGNVAAAEIKSTGKFSSESRELVLPRGQSGKIFALQTSRDGRILASLAEDRTAKLWDARTGREIREFVAQRGFFSSLALSFDGRFLATGAAIQEFTSNTKVELTVWDVQSGLAVKTFEEYGANSYPAINGLSFSPDGKLLAAIVGASQILYERIDREGKRIVVRDLETGRQIRIFSAEKNFRAAVFSADGKNLFVADGGFVKFIDLETGKTIKKIEAHQDLISALSLSTDGKMLATAGADDTARLWNVADGTLKQTLAGHDADVLDVNFSPDGKIVLTAAADAVMRFFNAADGALISSQKPIEAKTFAAVFALGEQVFVSAHNDGLIKIWDTQTKKERRTLNRQTETIKNLMFDPQNNNLIASTERGNRRWQLERLRLIDSPPLDFDLSRAVQNLGEIGKGYALTPDFSTFANYEVQEKSINIYSLVSKNRAADYPNLPGEFAWLGGLVEALKQPEKIVKLKNLPVGANPDSGLFYLALSADGKTIAAIGDAGIRVWNVANSSEKAKADGNFSFSSLALNSDGSRAAIASSYGLVAILETASNKLQVFREANLRYELEPVTNLTFSPDGKLLGGITLMNAQIKIWDAMTGAEKFTFAGHKDGTNRIIFHPTGKLLVSGGADGQTKIWDLNTGVEAASLITFGTRDFVAVTPDGFYTASKAAAQAISVRTGGELLPFEQFDLKYNRPDKVAGRVGLVGDETLEIFRQAVGRRLKKLGFTLDTAAKTTPAAPPNLAFVNEPPVQTNERSVNFKIKAEAGESNLKNLQITVNGVPFGTNENAFAANTKSAEKDLKIELNRGLNKIKIVAVNESGANSQPLEFEIRLETDFSKPDLYVLVVGVSTYAQSGNSLNYADKDADDVAKFFESKRPRFGKVEVHRLLNENATREKINAEREFLLRAGVEDEVVIFIAGHGLLDRDLNYYFGTYDIDFQNPSAKGLPYDELEKLLEGLRARKKLLLMDTCHAGEVDREKESSTVVQKDEKPAETKVNDAAADDKKSVIKRGTGIFQVGNQNRFGLQNSFELLGELFADLRGASGSQVIAAASGAQFSYERDNLKNGVFTFALLEALNSETADTNGDGKLQVFELRDYVNRRVTDLTDGGQTPVMRAENIEFDFSVY